MTEEKQIEENATEEEQAEELDPNFVLKIDPYLQKFVGLANAGVWQFGIVLTVQGVVVQGITIGIEEYYDTLSDLLLSQIPRAEEDDTALLRRLFKPLTPVALALAGTEPRFIHLKDAVIYEGGRTIHVGLWRGHLKDVNSFAYGMEPPAN